MQFTNTTENFRFSSATLDLSRERVGVAMNVSENAEIYLFLRVICSHLDWQVQYLLWHKLQPSVLCGRASHSFIRGT